MSDLLNCLCGDTPELFTREDVEAIYCASCFRSVNFPVYDDIDPFMKTKQLWNMRIEMDRLSIGIIFKGIK